MATKVKPCRLNVTGTPQVGDVPVYYDEDTFEWGAGGGGGSGDVTGPNSSTDGDVVLFDGNTGKIIKDSGVNLSSKLDTTALSDTNYGGAWSGDTTHTPTKNAIYTKLHTMDVEIGNKAADNTVVKLSGNQTIGGTKTFTTSPVVPSKTTDATNSGTAIATEAQVYKKSEIVYATQAEYTALLPGAASDGKHYFIYTSSTPSGWDMNNRALAQTSSALSGNWWGGVYLNPNGDKIYLTNVIGQKIYESDLDSPYDISNISFNKYISTSPGPEDIHFSTDGTKMFTVTETSSNCTVWQYDLSTAWDISSATLNNNKITGLSGYCRGLYISPDGLNVYVTIRNSNTFYKIPLATAWDLSSAGATISGSSTVGGLSLWIGNNGTFAAGGGDETESIIRYGTLTTPYDLSSVTGVDTKNVGIARAGGIWFNNEGTICVIVGGGSSTNYVTKYTL